MPANSISRLCALYHAKARPATTASRMNGGARMRRQSAPPVSVVMEQAPSNNHLATGLATAESFRHYIAGCEARRFATCRQFTDELRQEGSDMSTDYTSENDRLHAAEVFRSKWL